MKKLEASLHYQTGTITLLDGDVIIDTGNKFRYLSTEDAEKVIVSGWGNPPDDEKIWGCWFRRMLRITTHRDRPITLPKYG